VTKELVIAWSITMASYALGLPITTPLTYLSLFGVGAFIMRGAACTINDICDRELDKGVGESPPQSPCTHDRKPSCTPMWCSVLTGGWTLILVVERTKTRPIANGDVTVPQAVGFLGLQVGAGLGILTQSNWYR